VTVKIEPIKPRVGAIIRVDPKRLCDADVVEAVHAALEDRGVLVFPQMNLTDMEQLSFTDHLGGRVNFTRNAPGAMGDIYRITLDNDVNVEPDYILGTFFWHIDGVTIDMPLPRATVLSARKLSSSGGATEFANLYAAYDLLPEREKREIDGLDVVHTLEASVRPAFGHPTQERLERWRSMAPGMQHPLVWTHEDGRKSLLIGTHADGIVGMPGAHGRAVLCRLQQWAAQPDFVYRHEWQVGDLLVWNNQGVMHRVIPYSDTMRVMHRTSIAGIERPGRRASDEVIAKILEPM
jgi:alpha-ketoglutarate-dependent taurine dioxygenase